MYSTTDIPQQRTPMVGTEYNTMINASTIAAGGLFVQHSPHQCHHIYITIQMGSFLKRPIGVFGHIAQKPKMNPRGKFPSNLGHIIFRVRAQRATAQGQPIGHKINLFHNPGNISCI